MQKKKIIRKLFYTMGIIAIFVINFKYLPEIFEKNAIRIYKIINRFNK